MSDDKANFCHHVINWKYLPLVWYKAQTLWGMSFFFSILNYFVCQVDGTRALIKQKMCQTENNLHILPPAPTIFVGKQGIYRHFYALEKYLIKLANMKKLFYWNQEVAVFVSASMMDWRTYNKSQQIRQNGLFLLCQEIDPSRSPRTKPPQFHHISFHCSQSRSDPPSLF